MSTRISIPTTSLSRPIKRRILHVPLNISPESAYLFVAFSSSFNPRRAEKKEKMEMRCDPELRLSVGSQAVAGEGSNRASNSMRFHRMESLLRFSTAHQQQEQKKQMTIFYKGRIFVCDATEIQARAIISMAEKMEEIIGNQNLISQHDQQQEAMAESTVLPLPPSPSSETLPQMLNPGLSMKRSLQRFLQKRKARISEVTPYKQTPKLLFPLKPQHA